MGRYTLIAALRQASRDRTQDYVIRPFRRWLLWNVSTRAVVSGSFWVTTFVRGPLRLG